MTAKELLTILRSGEPSSFDWFDALDLMQELALNDPDKNYYTLHGALTARAERWPTCACGQLCKTIPKFGGGEPHDHILRDYGIEFMDAVSKGEWKFAKYLFKQIENRTTMLLGVIAATKANT